VFEEVKLDGKAGSDEPLAEPPTIRPFLLGTPVADLIQQFEIELVRQTETDVWLKLKPKQKKDAVWLREASLILKTDRYLPRGLKTVDVAGNETVHNFTNLRINAGDGVDLTNGPDLNGYRRVLGPR